MSQQNNGGTSAVLKGMIPGAFGGMCCTIVGHPIDVVKVRMQVQAPVVALRGTGAVASANSGRTTIVGMLRDMFVQDGIRGLYRGLYAPLLVTPASFAIIFWSFENAKAMVCGNNYRIPNYQPTITEITTSGALAGVLAAVVVAPSERIKCLMQVQTTSLRQKNNNSSSMVQCVQSLYRQGGIRSIFKGSVFTLLRDVPGGAAYFGMYEYIRRTICNAYGVSSQNLSPFATLMAGGLAGMFNVIVGVPADVLKSRYQTAPEGAYKGLYDVYHQLIRKEGIVSLYKGLTPALLRAFPANAACLLGVEVMKKTMSFMDS
eukprot:CAMPEP_0195516204 /NCGR_PEP_ID=MMETSP0794_2-20130614/6997_1 /TAXON_ID=515487 /ORGANISM="Stephanopyxis turris, Strain CCMP 815" /LENGTH=316 /DNA_ID=CAMNT_0040644737 /DNA_START=607 /DNA_END=1557 /DNA_ORIENTATION=+